MGCLIVKYQDRVYNTILKICQNRDDAAELTQDTFVKVLESIKTFHGKSGFYTWLFRVAVNLNAPVLFRVPPMTLSPPFFSTGRLSPVSMDSSTAE